jgi:ABC-type multidrug transport system fused ATPase/permease subunit
MSVVTSIRLALRLLAPRDRRLLLLAAGIQMMTSALDLIGVLLLGLVGALAVTTVQSLPPPEAVEQLVSRLGLSQLSSQELVVVFTAAAAAVLLSKSIISSILNRRVFIFLANRQALVTARLAKALLTRPLTFVQKRSSQETAYALIQGAGAATTQILGQLVVVLTESTLLVVLAAALLILNPIITLGAVAFFAAVALILQWSMGKWAARLGSAAAEADIASLNSIQEALAAYREISVADRREFYIERIQSLRWQAAQVSAETSFIGMLPKYIFEAALVVGGFALAAVLFATEDSIQAIATLALFIAASSRVMPSLLRLQGAALSLRGAAGSAGSTFELAQELGNPLEQPEEIQHHDQISRQIRSGHPGLVASVVIDHVYFRYPGASVPALRGVSLTALPGESVALVGRSGSGKSTLADLVLGVLEPESGDASIDGMPPALAVKRWPGGIAYVPQSVLLANGTVRDNVALGLPRQAIDDELVWEALTRSHLDSFLRTQRDGLDTNVGEGGIRLSGGQRQRLGLARALFTRPRLLVLDEATSALDAETEVAITETIRDLEGHVTTVIIAHRLSTVREVDKMYFLDHGSVEAVGTFDEVRAAIPGMDRQARLMGL